MGLIKIIELNQNPVLKLGLWELDEDSQSMHSNFIFTENEKIEYDRITNERRKCEYLAVRLLLQSMLLKKTIINYNHCGKPSINSNFNISISHSSEIVAVLLSDIPAGIDAESIYRNTEKVAPRFLSENEQNHISQTHDPALTRILYWCAKEAVFKCSPLTEIEFRTQILIEPFQPMSQSGNFTGLLLKDEQHVKFAFQYFIFKDNAVVICMSNS